ncbi:MAG: insulinase family protein [Rhodothermales bacterium]|nr:insulinase family protein [Rhodothermales bacterium]
MRSAGAGRTPGSSTTTDNFRKTTLPNGVRVVSESIPTVRSISVGAWVFTGSRDERRSKEGLSHFIEHMVFKGTRSRRMHQIASRMEAVGGYLNAFTGKEYTCFYARALDNHLSRAVETVTDLILAPTFPEKELQKEKEVVLEEIKMYEDTPEENIFDHFEDAIYSGHSLAHPVLGTRSSVMGFTRDDLLDYLERKYLPSRMVIAAAGNLDHDRLVQYVAAAFDKSDRENRRFQRRKVNGYRSRHVESTSPVQQAHLLVGTRGCSTYADDRLALIVLNILLGGGMSSRLNQNIREKYGYCYSIYSFLNFHSDSGDFGIYTATEPGKIDRTHDLIIREVDKMRSKKVGPRALSQARSQVKGSIMLGLESMSSRMMRIGKQELYHATYVTMDRLVEMVDDVSADDVLAAAIAYLSPEDFSSVTIRPESRN